MADTIWCYVYPHVFNLEIMKNIYYNPHSRQQGELFHTKIGGLTSGASRRVPPSVSIYIYTGLKKKHIGYILRDRAENSKIKSPVQKRDPIDRFSAID